MPRRMRPHRICERACRLTSAAASPDRPNTRTRFASSFSGTLTASAMPISTHCPLRPSRLGWPSSKHRCPVCLFLRSMAAWPRVCLRGGDGAAASAMAASRSAGCSSAAGAWCGREEPLGTSGQAAGKGGMRRNSSGGAVRQADGVGIAAGSEQGVVSRCQRE